MMIKEVITQEEKKAIETFLAHFELDYQQVDHTIYMEDQNKLVGTISCYQDMITSFAVLEEVQGQNVGAMLITKMIHYLYAQKKDHLFIYTKPMYKSLFEQFGFREIASTETICLLESVNRSIEQILKKHKDSYGIGEEPCGAIVVNCNPFTKGHLYLITEASKHHEKLLVFVVEEDRSYFPFADRFYLVQQGTKHLKNVRVVPSTKYIISTLTFPTYFLKQDVDEVMEHARLDIQIFKKYFIPIFNIQKRYVGTETDKVTTKYNQAMKEVLLDDLIEIPRIQVHQEDISASKVRSLLNENRLSELKELVPEATYEYLRNR